MNETHAPAAPLTRYVSLHDALESAFAADDRFPLSRLVPTADDAAGCDNALSPVLGISHGLRVLDLDGADAAAALAPLLAGSRLYRLSAELALDMALTRAREDDNRALGTLLKTAFADRGMPIPHGAAFEYAPTGDLKHPLLIHLDHAEFSDIYARFLRALPQLTGGGVYGFDRMINLNRAYFFESFDGYRTGGIDYLRLDAFLKYGHVARAAATPDDADTDSADPVGTFVTLDRRQVKTLQDLMRALPVMSESPPWVDAEIAALKALDARKDEIAALIKRDVALHNRLSAARNIAAQLDREAARMFSVELYFAIEGNNLPLASSMLASMIRDGEMRTLEAELIPGLAPQG